MGGRHTAVSSDGHSLLWSALHVAHVAEMNGHRDAALRQEDFIEQEFSADRLTLGLYFLANAVELARRTMRNSDESADDRIKQMYEQACDELHPDGLNKPVQDILETLEDVLREKIRESDGSARIETTDIILIQKEWPLKMPLQLLDMFLAANPGTTTFQVVMTSELQSSEQSTPAA